MTELVERMLERMGVRYVHLNGSVPSKQRRDLMISFREHPDCRVFLSTDAGGVGLNLQSGSIVINMDVPWNPAVLEQRIARAHRMGQRRPVDVYLLATEGTFEEKLLGTLADKQNLALAVLDT